MNNKNITTMNDKEKTPKATAVQADRLDFSWY